MKKIISVSLVALLATATLTTSCNKYEGGPGISLMSKKSRLANDWQMTKLTKNDVEQDISNYTQKISIKKDGTYTSSSSYSFMGQVYNTSDSGTWEFNDDKTKLLTLVNGETVKDTVTIYRLTNSELQFKDVDGSDTYITTMTPQ